MAGTGHRGQPALAHDRKDAVDLVHRQAHDVLGPVDREVALTIRLVGRERAAGHLGEDAAGDGRQRFAIRAAHLRRIDVHLSQVAAVRVAPEAEAATLAHDGMYRPHAGDVVAPPGRAAGDHHRDEVGLVQTLEREIGITAQPAIGSERVVEIEQHAAQSRTCGARKFRQRAHVHLTARWRVRHFRAHRGVPRPPLHVSGPDCSRRMFSVSGGTCGWMRSVRRG